MKVLLALTPANCGHAAFEILQGARQLLLDLQPPINTSSDNNIANCKALHHASDILIDYAYEKLNAFPYRQVPACWRELYTDAGLLHGLALWYPLSTDISDHRTEQRGNHHDPASESVETRRLAIRVLDKALVLAGACGPGRKTLIMDAIEALEREIENMTLLSTSPIGDSLCDMPPSKKLKTDHDPEEDAKVKTGSSPSPIRPLGEEEDENARKAWPKIEFSIPRWHQPSLEMFARHIHQPNPTPVILTGAMDHWPALTKWTDLDKLCKAAGPDRLVPIEIGRQYTDEHWTQKMVTTREFIEQYILHLSSASPSSTTSSQPKRHDVNNSDHQETEPTSSTTPDVIGYLAQHNLFEQIPRLRRDIDIPDYCCVGPAEDIEGGYEPPDDTLLHAWFGPKGTVSPLHTDPYHNLLAQVVGYKYVRLYAPSQTPYLYSFGSHSHEDHDGDTTSSSEAMLLGNTSQVDIEQADLSRYPLFAQAEYVETILAPGELLYIPFQWWHYIRSLSVSFSVSFWF
ncbi:hypothetical protein BGZ73_002867 [Actinomortierella ambigua]|nr:hypothetical protein BGZ73_002867 [Actinomortierella ambigua]